MSFAAALALIEADEPTFRRTARRYSLCPDDAEDAYQRAVEILLTKAPDRSRPELAAWMQVVTRREALAVRRSRERLVTMAGDDDPEPDAIYKVGTLASVLQLLKLPDGTVKVLVEGVERAKIGAYSERSDFYQAEATVMPNDVGEKVDWRAQGEPGRAPRRQRGPGRDNRDAR